jgi:ParB/RepB/Spo0J family partition protein
MSNASEPKSTLKNIKLSDIRENPVALRSVDRKNPDYQQLVDSVRTHGVLESILVRELKDAETGETYYGLINGLQRFSASQDAGKETVPAKVVSLSDAEVLEAQIITNVHRVETKPVEYSKQLIRILSGNPTMTISNLAAKLAKSPSWVSERLGLVKLEESVAKLVDDNKINLSNAYALAKLPPEEQANFIDRAMTLTPQEFVPTVNNRVKEIREAKRQGRDTTKLEFTPVAHAQKLSALKAELESPSVGPALVERVGVTTAEEGFALGVAWSLHMDPLSIEQAKADDEARKAKEADAKAKRKQEAQDRRAKAAAEAQAGVKEAVGVES